MVTHLQYSWCNRWRAECLYEVNNELQVYRVVVLVVGDRWGCGEVEILCKSICSTNIVGFCNTIVFSV